MLIKIMDLMTACRVYVNGQLVRTIGIPGRRRATTTPDYAAQILGLEYSRQLNTRFDILKLISTASGRNGPV